MPRRPRSRQPIPKNARRVFHGVRFDVYQWRQKMFDGSFETFEKLDRPDTADIIPITTDRKILVLEQKQPDDRRSFWCFPGGVINRNEEPRTAARRELLEETGYEAGALELWDTFMPLARIDWTIHTYIARHCKKTRLQHLDAGERIKVHAVTWPQLMTIIDKPDFRNIHIALHLLRAARVQKKLAALRHRLLGA